MIQERNDNLNSRHSLSTRFGWHAAVPSHFHVHSRFITETPLGRTRSKDDSNQLGSRPISGEHSILIGTHVFDTYAVVPFVLP